jgi:hypothetical protein
MVSAGLPGPLSHGVEEESALAELIALYRFLALHHS